MKQTTLLLSTLAVSGMLACSASAQGSLGLNFSSTPGSTIQFNGAASSFQFNPSTSSIFGGVFLGSQWIIGSQTGGIGGGVGLKGLFNNGPFSYGPITTVGSEQSATVTGPTGQLVIQDGSGFDLTGNIDWLQISTFNSSGAINADLVVNVTGLNYAGSNPDLLTLVANGPGALNLTYQFSPGKTLSDLTKGSGSYQTSYSGSLSVVPEPTSTVCLLLGLGALTLSRRKIFSKRA
jgi:hypothetical protein